MNAANLIFRNCHAENIEFKLNITQDNQYNNEKNKEIKDNLKIEIGIGQDKKQFAVKMTYKEQNIYNCYDLKVIFVGHFAIKDDAEESIDDFSPNAVAILFPYFRSAITAFTTAAGVKPLVIPIINFAE